ncbi:hypothetical protein ADUPG1_010485 [Aduncisulcus paluster]|uniref:Uncharacterized protein n=1 Tax=Aduncisulcus paluster TaxID=2918883 RepID=A0ABQ5JRJ3_9EUKA|nr:hypothetical protein ADUPG1_010485 [Aduncisulcus paluster]
MKLFEKRSHTPVPVLVQEPAQAFSLVQSQEKEEKQKKEEEKKKKEEEKKKKEEEKKKKEPPKQTSPKKQKNAHHSNEIILEKRLNLIGFSMGKDGSSPLDTIETIKPLGPSIPKDLSFIPISIVLSFPFFPSVSSSLLSCNSKSFKGLFQNNGIYFPFVPLPCSPTSPSLLKDKYEFSLLMNMNIQVLTGLSRPLDPKPLKDIILTWSTSIHRFCRLSCSLSDCSVSPLQPCEVKMLDDNKSFSLLFSFSIVPAPELCQNISVFPIALVDDICRWKVGSSYLRKKGQILSTSPIKASSLDPIYMWKFNSMISDDLRVVLEGWKKHPEHQDLKWCIGQFSSDKTIHKRVLNCLLKAIRGTMDKNVQRRLIGNEFAFLNVDTATYLAFPPHSFANSLFDFISADNFLSNSSYLQNMLKSFGLRALHVFPIRIPCILGKDEKKYIRNVRVNMSIRGYSMRKYDRLIRDSMKIPFSGSSDELLNPLFFSAGSTPKPSNILCNFITAECSFCSSTNGYEWIGFFCFNNKQLSSFVGYLIHPVSITYSVYPESSTSSDRTVIHMSHIECAAHLGYKTSEKIGKKLTVRADSELPNPFNWGSSLQEVMEYLSIITSYNVKTLDSFSKAKFIDSEVSCGLVSDLTIWLDHAFEIQDLFSMARRKDTAKNIKKLVNLYIISIKKSLVCPYGYSHSISILSKALQELCDKSDDEKKYIYSIMLESVHQLLEKQPFSFE